MNKILWRKSRILVFLGLILMIVSCNKKPDKIGLDLLEGEKLVIGADTTDFIIAYSYREDSVVTSYISKPQSLLGSFYDPVFGVTNASIYTQLRVLEATPDTIGPDFHVDSVILSLVYAGSYGNIDAYQTIRVYRLLEEIESDTSYYSNQSLEYDLNDWGELGSFTFQPNPSDSVLVPSDTLYQSAAVRIPLSEEFGERILTLEDSALVDNDKFLEAFKGLYITTDPARYPNDGSIIYYQLASSRSLVTIYYNDTSELPLYINNLSRRFEHFEHFYSQSTNNNFIEQVYLNDSTKGTESLYLQSMGGVEMNLFFPGLNEWADGRSLAIHEAKLIFTVNTDNYAYEPPSQLNLFAFNEEGELQSLDDEYQLQYFGGKYNEDSKEYIFRISFYIQGLLNGNEDYGLNLSIAGKTYTANGLVLQGTDTELESNLRLEIIYSEL